jgi:hypothetical protein
VFFSEGWVVFNKNVATSAQWDGDVDGVLAAAVQMVFV